MGELSAFVAGTPLPQGSARAFVVGDRARVTTDDKRTYAWRSDVITAFTDQTGGNLQWGRGVPVAVDVLFAFRRPSAHYRTGQYAGLLRDVAPVFPAGRPDVDKLARSILDALSAANLWHDDSQVVNLSASKAYVDIGRPEGATISAQAML